MSRTGIIAPMPVEASPLVPVSAHDTADSGAGFPVYRWQTGRTEVSLACSGVGLLRAAAATRHLIEGYQVDRVIVVGVAGGLAPGCRVGSLLLPDAVRGYVQPSSGGVIAAGPTNEDAVGPMFSTDDTLRRVALGAASGAPGGGLLVTVRGVVTSIPILQWFRDCLSATAVDMESAAVGEVCSVAGVPFLVVRAVSDHAPELARWNWAGVARARKRGRPALACHVLRRPALLARMWRLRREMRRGAQEAAKLVREILVSVD